MKHKPLFFVLSLMLVINACKKPDPEKNFAFRYALGSSTDYRHGTEGAFYYSQDSIANMIVKFNNNDSLHFLFVTHSYPSKTTYLFGQDYGIDSDIMIVDFRNNQSNPRYWVLDQGIYKNGSLTLDSWKNGFVEGSFDFDANTTNPEDFTNAVLNFKGSFTLPVK